MSTMDRKREKAVDSLRHLAKYATFAADRIEGDNPGDHALATNLLSLVADAVPALAVVDQADWAAERARERNEA